MSTLVLRRERLPKSQRSPPASPAHGFAAPGDVLLVGRRSAALEQALARRGCEVVRTWTFVTARQRLWTEPFAVVLVEPDVGGEDGVAFAVGAKGGGELPSWLPPRQARVPFVVLPERGDLQAVVYWGYERYDAVEGDTAALADLVLALRSGR